MSGTFVLIAVIVVLTLTAVAFAVLYFRKEDDEGSEPEPMNKESLIEMLNQEKVAIDETTAATLVTAQAAEARNQATLTRQAAEQRLATALSPSSADNESPADEDVRKALKTLTKRFGG